VNCTRIAQWLPLYASADLPAPQQAQVRAHLAQCESCSVAVAEFAAARAWLQCEAVPEFDEAFFAELRYAVRQELAAQPVRSTWLRWRWLKPGAVAAALLLLTIFSLRLFQTKGVPRTDIVNSPALPQLPDAVRKLMPLTHVFAQTQKSRGPLRKQGNALRIKQEEKTAVVAATAAQLTKPASPNGAETIAEPLMSRIEIQTADPNIRIIWLTQNTQRAMAEPLAR
jgi:anti-sigma factor RsiW